VARHSGGVAELPASSLRPIVVRGVERGHGRGERPHASSTAVRDRLPATAVGFTLGWVPGRRYAKWCGASVDEEEITALRAATAAELALGSEAFLAHIEAMTARATLRGRPGPRGPHASTTSLDKLRL